MLLMVKQPAADPLPKVEDAHVEGLLDRIQTLRDDLTRVEDADKIRELRENARFESKTRDIAAAACVTLLPTTAQLALRDECIEASKKANSAEHRARIAVAKRASDSVPELASIVTGIGLLMTELADTMEAVDSFTANNSVKPHGAPHAWRKGRRMRDMASQMQALAYNVKHNVEG